MAHDEIERETVPLPDSETPAPAQGHLFGGADLDGGLGAEDEDGAHGEGDGPIGAAVPAQDPAQSGADEAGPEAHPEAHPDPDPDPDSIPVTSSRTAGEPPPDLDLDAPDDRPRPPADPRARTVPLPEARTRRPSNRSKGLIAAAVAGVLVVGGAVAATVGGGSGKAADKSAAPTAGLPGRQDSDNGAAVPTAGGTEGSPWAWQTGQPAPKSPGATTSTAATPGAPTPTGPSSGPGTPTPTGPGAGPRSSSAPGQPSSSPPATPSSSGGGIVPPPSVTPATTKLVVGPGCPGLAGGGGYYTIGNGSSSGWGSNGSGGWSGDGCNGSMQSMPMTGDSTNGSNRALWYFGSGTAGFASCTISVYVPWDGKATDTGGTAAEYQIVEGSAETYVTSFTVDQNTTHGQWVTLGTVAVGGQTVKVRLVDHGVDYPDGWRYGIAAAKLKCTT